MSVLVFVSRDFELGRTWLAGGVDRQSRTPHGANFLLSADLLFVNFSSIFFARHFFRAHVVS